MHDMKAIYIYEENGYEEKSKQLPGEVEFGYTPSAYATMDHLLLLLLL